MLAMLLSSIVTIVMHLSPVQATSTYGASLKVDDPINRINATLGIKSGSQVTTKGTITNVGATTLTDLLTGVYFIEGTGVAKPADFSFEFSLDCATWFLIDPSEVKLPSPAASPMQVELVIGQFGGETLAPGASLTVYIRMTLSNDLTPITWPNRILQSIIVWVFKDANQDRHWEGINANPSEPLYSQNTTYHGWYDWDNPIKIDLAIVHTAEIDGTGKFYYNIQDAINAASPGDTIWVYPGTYNEQVSISKQLSVIGLGGAGQTFIDATGLVAMPGSSFALVTINAPGSVLFQGFTVQNAWNVAHDREGILTQCLAASPTYAITSNRIYGTNNASDDQDYGFYAQSGKENIVFSNNVITQTGANNIVCELHTGSTEISGNALDAGAYGTDPIFLMTYNGIDITTLQNVSYNTFDMGTGEAFDYGHRATGVSFATPGAAWGLGEAKFTNMVISRNTFNNLKSNRRGIGFWNANNTAHNIVSPKVTYNTIIGIPASAGSFGIDFYGLTDNAVITHNKITGVDTAVYLRNGDALGTKINYNCIVGNTLGVNWTIGLSSVNATLNWWGSDTGPKPTGSGDGVTAKVDFNPWLNSTFDYNPKKYPLEGAPVTFDASKTIEPCSVLKTIASYTWNFSDGSVTTTPNPVIVHSFANFGIYNVSLTLSFTDLSTYKCSALVHVAKAPTASFVYSPIPAGEMDTITSDAGGSTPNGGIIVNYEWNFGDGNVTSTPSSTITHVFALHGNYLVTLNVTDDEGLSGITSKNVDVLIHDVAVVDVTPYRNWTYQGRTIKINVTVANLGNFTETAEVALYYNITAGNLVGPNQTVTLNAGEIQTLTFAWDTTGVPYRQNYTMTAAITRNGFDSNLTNNILDSPTKIKVRILGDINGDDKVDTRDLYKIALAFGSYGPNKLYLGSPAHPNWNADADINEDNVINAKDYYFAAANFGK